MTGQEPDPRPGFYYVSVIDGARRAILRGPWVDNHRGALDAVDSVRREADRVDPRAVWYAFGTLRSVRHLGPGALGGPVVPLRSGHAYAPTGYGMVTHARRCANLRP